MKIIGFLGVFTLTLVGQERLVMSGVNGHAVRPKVLSSSMKTAKIQGKDAAVFSLITEEETTKILFDATQGKNSYFAELVSGDDIIPLAAIALDKFEGHNEPPLKMILEVLGTDVNPGGTELRLDTKENEIGDSVLAPSFEPVAGKSFRIQGLARFSPPGITPFGFVLPDGELQEIGSLDTVSEKTPDTHQCLLPPTLPTTEGIIVENPPKHFGLFLKARHYTSVTKPGAAKGAKIKHTARVYPVKQLLGRDLENAFLVCFEEASNGDYQDAVFLIEGVKISN